ncbi:hypothetical protein [Shewanella marisflavi]|uniref:hypothetical protein n=1 Tax=Shewanella marisflavi TaxID=260364 RepID=UPI003AAA6F91
MPRFQCPKCTNGQGYINAYYHVLGGVCFHCKGKGFVEQKSAPRKSKTYVFSFLWTNPKAVNYRDGEFCICFKRKARSLNAAIKIAEQSMKNNGSQDFRVEEST